VVGQDMDRLRLSVAENLGQWLRKTNKRIVFAESCTAGLVSASLGTVPGISRFLCGSFVVYRPESKSGWLGIPKDLLEVYGAESIQCSVALARLALHRTPEADFCVSITGDLGPGAPEDRDGLAHIAVVNRKVSVGFHSARTPTSTICAKTDDARFEIGSQLTCRLESVDRKRRQIESAIEVMQASIDWLELMENPDLDC